MLQLWKYGAPPKELSIYAKSKTDETPAVMVAVGKSVPNDDAEECKGTFPDLSVGYVPGATANILSNV